MTDLELRGISSILSKLVKESVNMAKAELRAEYQKYVTDHIDSLPPGDPGKDAVPVDFEALAERAAALIKAPDPVDTDAIVLRVAELFTQPKDGKDGRDGIDGKDGLPGSDGANGAAGQRGEQGERGESVIGPPGERGERGLDGKDAVIPDLEPMIQRVFDVGSAKWALDFERRAQDLFQRAIDKMPKPVDGKDGFELEDLSVTDDGHGNVTLTFKRGELTRSFSLRLPCFEYRGVFVDGERYLSGHGVTYGGSFWITSRDDAQGKPGDQQTDWILAVKKGRDGKDGVVPVTQNGPVKLK